MAIRTLKVEPTGRPVEIDGQVFETVTAEDMAAVLNRLAVVLDFCGGHGTISTQRIPTGVPNEYVTVRAAVTWMDLTNAKPRPEPDARVVAEAPPEPVEAVEDAGILPLDEAPPEEPELVDDGVGDGLLYDPEAEDVSEVPAALR